MCFTKTLSFTSPEKDFFIYIHGVISSPEKEKRSVLYHSDISDMFPVTGGNFIHTCRHVHIVFAGVCLCASTCGQASVCVWPADAHLQQQSICRRRSWCRQSSLRYMYTRYHIQQRAELDRVPFYFMKFSPPVTGNMCRGA